MLSCKFFTIRLSETRESKTQPKTINKLTLQSFFWFEILYTPKTDVVNLIKNMSPGFTQLNVLKVTYLPYFTFGIIFYSKSTTSVFRAYYLEKFTVIKGIFWAKPGITHSYTHTPQPDKQDNQYLRLRSWRSWWGCLCRPAPAAPHPSDPPARRQTLWPDLCCTVVKQNVINHTVPSVHLQQSYRVSWHSPQFCSGKS